MKISFNWLNTHIKLSESPEQIAELLTNCGLEVEDLYKSEGIKGGLEGLIVGHVLELVQHPNADKLQLAKVDIGDSQLNIVCGAQNIAKGQKVVVAPIGCTIYNIKEEPLIIRRAKIRGEESEGMICAEDEIGLGSSHDGILILDAACSIGASVANYFKLESDWIFEIGLTPNRGDAASHLGVARDLKAILNRPLINSAFESIKTQDIKLPLKTPVADKNYCGRYCGVSIRGIQVQPSPDWLQKKLKAIAVNPINNIVDFTNFIMHDIGQPLHAFDADKLNGSISVRMAVKNETLVLLDKTERKLTGEELIIADGSGPIALAGVMGGLATSINETTKNIFIESAWFDAASVRKNAKIHTLTTDSSFRFERGIDPHNTQNALAKTVKLIADSISGIEVSEFFDFLPETINFSQVDFKYQKFKTIAGLEIETTKLKTILQNLDIIIESEDKDGLRLLVPNYRTDVKRDIDVFEDILRIYGYNNIPFPETIHSAPVPQPKPNKNAIKQTIGNYLSAQGFNEIATNSLTRETYYDQELLAKAIRLVNPLSSELSIMRLEMLPNMLEAVAYNKNRKSHDLKFYEFGKVYFQTETGFKEIEKLCMLVTGHKEEINWNQKPLKTDYYYLKAMAINALASVGASKIKSLTIEEVSPELLKKFDIKGKVMVAEVDFEAIIKAKEAHKFKLVDIPLFPEVSRDLNLILNKTIKFNQVETIVNQTMGHYLRKLSVIDVYEGKPLTEEQKSYTINMLLYDPEKTMTDTQIDQLMQKLMATFESKLNAVIRKSS